MITFGGPIEGNGAGCEGYYKEIEEELCQKCFGGEDLANFGCKMVMEAPSDVYEMEGTYGYDPGNRSFCCVSACTYV